MYKSDYCEVEDLNEFNVVFVTQKQYCEFEDYRKPLNYALEIIKNHKNCNYAVDTRNGFENNPADTEWMAEILIPQAVEYGCKTVCIIVDKSNPLADELKGQEEDSKGKMEFRYIFNMSEI